MKVFVTGGSGFLGKRLCQLMKKQGISVIAPTSKECNLRLPHSLQSYTVDSYDYIYHLAAWTQAGDFCLKHPGEQWIINQQINTNILSWWKEFHPKSKLICMGTSCSYAPFSSLVEENYLFGEPIDSLYTYAMTKRMLLCGLRSIAKQFDLKYFYAIPSTLYGPGYHTDGRQMHFIFDLIRKILAGVEFDTEVVLWGNGEQKRELIHVDDFCKALLYLAPWIENEIVNIGSGEEYSIKSFAKIICDNTGYPFEKIMYDTSKYVGAKSKVLCIEKLKRLYPAFKLKSCQVGLQETIEWFKKNAMTCSS